MVLIWMKGLSMNRIASVLQVAGVGFLSLGAGLFHLALGLMTAGVGCVLFGLALERGD